MKKVLIPGGGFAGMQAAVELPKKKIFEITLVLPFGFSGVCNS
jgi:NADH dehydrogenase FAD-containing subunit